MSVGAGIQRETVGVVSRAEFRAALEVIGRYTGDKAGSGCDLSDLLDDITACDRATSALAAIQMRQAVTFSQRRKAEDKQLDFESRHARRSVVAELALARRQSPAKTSRWLTVSESLAGQMPGVFAALRKGVLTEWRATLIARETTCLTPEHRGRVDEALAADPRLATMSDREAAKAAGRAAYELDPRRYLDRDERAEQDRHVSVRPAHEAMAWFTALLPLKQAVAMFAAVRQGAEQARAAGDPRTVSQLQADIAFERVTGHQVVDQIPVEIQLVMTAHSLLGLSEEPAEVSGHGPVPAELVRRQLRELADRADGPAAAWIRRMWSNPSTGELAAMDSARREFGGNLRRLILTRDQVCRTPWCGAPIRHLDHVQGHEHGGATSASNGQGLCENCNYVKQAPGWKHQPGPGGAGQSVEITTPTGHTHTSIPPPLPGSRPGSG